ncbi:MAG: hypothetical protein JW934_04855 [Anaerolineae bacterium]|nr:hypothetical protein [Anaerolineae bacterium]
MTGTLGTLSVLAAIALFSSQHLVSLPAQAQNGVGAAEAALINGELELPYNTCLDGDACQLANGWTLWHTTQWFPDEQFIDRPNASTESSILRPGSPGSTSQHIYRRGASNFDACLSQQITQGITVGNWIRFSIWARLDTSMAIPDAQTRIGIDPNGGTNPLDIQYETHQSYWDVFDAGNLQWQYLSISMRATSPAVTVYACAHPRWAMSFDAYWDDAEFVTASPQFVYLPIVTQKHCTVPPGELWNSDLEKEFCILTDYQKPIPGYDNVFVAPYWMPFWNSNYNDATWENAQPEYNKTDRDYRRYSGQTSQQYGHSSYKRFEAGIYQVVSGTVPGQTYRFTIYGLGWIGSPGNPNDRISNYQEPGGLSMRVGIDPYGGNSYTSSNIIWSAYTDPYDVWTPLSVTATASAEKISVWAYAHPQTPLYYYQYHQIFLDSASLTIVSP